MPEIRDGGTIPEELLREAQAWRERYANGEFRDIVEAMAAFGMAARKDERERATEAERGRVKVALSKYRASLGDIPLGHENRQRGASTYNWKVSVYEEIADAILSDEEQSHAE